jgi:hypothetical protein
LIWIHSLVRLPPKSSMDALVRRGATVVPAQGRISRSGGRPAWGRSSLCRHGGQTAEAHRAWSGKAAGPPGVDLTERSRPAGGGVERRPSLLGASSSSSFGFASCFFFLHTCRSVKRLGLPCQSAVGASNYTRNLRVASPATQRRLDPLGAPPGMFPWNKYFWIL